MGKFKLGDTVILKSNRGIRGAIIGVKDGLPENRYQVYTTIGKQSYYESQLERDKQEENLREVNADRFNAGLTASLIRNPSISSQYSFNMMQIEFVPY